MQILKAPQKEFEQLHPEDFEEFVETLFDS
jgi:hypothetical protein